MAKIQISNLTKVYDQRKVIDRLTYTFEDGFYILKGKNGDGKTTLFNLIAGYLTADQGKIEVDGTLFYSFQDETVFHNLTVLQNLMIFMSPEHKSKWQVSRKDIERVLGKLNILHLIDQPVNRLSGGERQKLELAKVMLFKPDIVLMDEPTARLDEEAREEFYRTMPALCEGKLVIIITHDHNIPEGTSSHILRLENGKIRDEL